MIEKKKTTDEKLDIILANEKKILENEAKILGEEKRIEGLEQEELALEQEEIDMEKKDLAGDLKIEKSEEDILHEMELIEKDLDASKEKILKKITKKDIAKGFVGAFIGITGHFVFLEAAHYSHEINVYRASIFYAVALFIIVTMLYFTGFRSVEKHFVMKFMPIRALLLYGVSILAVLIVNLIFGQISLPLEFVEIYKLVGASMILAVIGAGTADLIGGSE